MGLVVTACSAQEADEPIPAEELRPIVAAWAERNEVPTVAVSVRSPSGGITSVGYSDDGASPGDSSLFLIGSLAKTMTAATTLLLVDDGVLELDAAIQQWLPDFPRADELTLRHLLSHTAGLGQEASRRDLGINASNPEAFADLATITTTEELLIEAASSVGTQSLPAAHEYTSLGYVVAGAVIEAATGEELANVMQARLFEPLGMVDSHLEWPEPAEDDLVLGQMTIPGGLLIGMNEDMVRGVSSRGWAAGGVLSTSRDVAKFYGAVLDTLLGQMSVEAMTTTALNSDYGLGIAERRWEVAAGWGHSGVNAGYASSAGVTSDGWAVAVLTNHVDLLDATGSGRNARDLIGELLAHIDSQS